MTANMRQRTDIGITTGWKRRSPGLERELTATAAYFILLSIAPAVSIAELLPKSSSCIGEDCAAAATMILNNMDRSVEPCDNFYRYVCGGYINSTKLSAGQNTIRLFHTVQIQLHAQLRAIVKAEIEPNEPRAYRLVKKYYKSCMNEIAIEARGVQPLLATLRRIGGWPMIEGPSWNERNFDWTKAIDELRESAHHVQVFMTIKGAQNIFDRSKNAIWISPPDRVRFDDSLTNVIDNVTLAANVDFTLDLVMSLGAQNNTGIQEEIEEVWKFAFNLERLPSSRNNKKRTLTQLKRYYPRIPWQEYIYKRLPSTVSTPIKEVIIVKRPTYFTQLNKLLSNTPKRVLANYIALTTALESMQYLNEAMLEKVQQSSTTVATSRQKMCMQSVFSLSFVIESMYVSRHFSADTKRDVTSIMEDVRKGVRELLETASWLDRITKSRALQKLDAMGSYIAYADQPSNDTLDKIYESLDIDEDHYYENTHKVSRFNVDYSLRNLRQPVEKLGPSFEITEAMARYRKKTNIFALTPGLLRDNYYGKDRPRFMNYGAIGTLIGHEITHAFDSSGRRFDERGKEVNWWQPSSAKEFSKRAQCIVDQYNNYTVPEVGVHINGALTLDENIADNGGLRGAYLAYNNWVTKSGEEPKLPGIDMTPYQLFWISTATRQCTKARTDYLLRRIRKEEHGLPEFRIVGAMSNIPEFARDFKCPVGSNMNPSKKCRLW